MKIQDYNVLINNTYILSPPLANIIPFVFLLNVFKIRLLGRDLHTLINNVLFSSPTDMRSHNPHPNKYCPICTSTQCF